MRTTPRRAGAGGAAAADTTTGKSGRKQFSNNGSLHSTVDSVVFGAILDGSNGAAAANEPRDFMGAAGTPSKAAEHSGIFGAGHASHAQAAYGARASADSLDIDCSSVEAIVDPREVAGCFDGAAGSRSGQMAAPPPGSLNEQPRADRVTYADIPHSTFAPSGIKRVPQQPPQVAGLLQGGAAARVLLSGSTGDVEELVVGHQLGPNGRSRVRLTGAHSEHLYRGGAGSRSHQCPSHVAASDVAQRATAQGRLSDEMVYGRGASGAGVLVGTGSGGAGGGGAGGSGDPRDFGASAGQPTATLGARQLGERVDITQARHLGAPRDVGGRVGAPTDFHQGNAQGVRSATSILEGGDATSPYEQSEYAGVGSRFLAPGEPGQRKWHIHDDFVMTRPVADISDALYRGEADFPSAG